MFINKSKTKMQNQKDKRRKEKLVIQLLQNPKLSSHMKCGRTKELVNNFTKTKQHQKHKSGKEKLVDAMHIH
jgi:sugar diacid utilization regulator